MNNDPLHILDEEDPLSVLGDDEDPLGLIQTSEEKSSSWLAAIGKGTWGLAKRTAGVGIGIANAPLAAVWGSQAAAVEYKGPQWKRELVGLKGGLESAWRSITKKGDFGTLYGDYYKTVKGKTIEEDLPDNLKWAAPTLEMLANIVSDPLISFGEAGRIAQLRVPKGFIGKMPKSMVDDLNKLEKLEGIEKADLQQRLVNVLEGRKDYMRWWEEEGIPEIMRRSAEERRILAESRAQRPFQTAEELGVKKVAKEVPEITKRIKAKPIPEPSVTPTKEEALRKIEVFREEKGLPPLVKEKPEDVLKTKLAAAQEKARPPKEPWPKGSVEEKAEGLAIQLNKEMPGHSVKFDDVQEGMKTNFYQFTPYAGKWEGATFNVTTEKLTLEGVKAKLAEKMKAAPEGIKLPPKVVTEVKPPPITTLRATGGLVAGIEEDEQGNITYNIGKGTAGALLFAGGLKVRNLSRTRRFKQTLAKNPAWAKVASQIGKRKQSFELPALLSKINVKLFDRFAPIREKSQRAYEATRTFSAYKDQSQIKFNELNPIFAKVAEDDATVTHYILAHRDVTRAQRGIPNPDGVTLREAKQAIKEIEMDWLAKGKKVENLRNARDGFKKWTHDSILKESLDSGLISKAAYDDIVKNNKWYATFDVLDRMPESIHDIPALPSSEYFSVTNQNIIKKMVGTKKLIVDPIEATVRKFAQAQATFARNKVASTLIDDPAMKPFLRSVAMSKEEFGIMKNKGLNPIMTGAWSKKEFGTINRFKDGRVERYLVPIEIAESMKQLSPFQAPRVLKALGNIFRKSATSLYLPFTISNAMRDAFMAYTTSPVYKTTGIVKFGKDWTKGFWEGAKHEFLGSSDLAKTYVKSGGGFGYVGNLRQGKLAKRALFKKGMIKNSNDIITFANPFKLIEKISTTIELAPRLGIFQRARMMKIADADAALIARQSTIDFNRGGTWTKVVNQFVPFLNARIQGRVTLASALKRDPKGTAAKVFLAAAVPGMAAYAWNRLYHSDLYDDIPEYVKQNYFTIITGSTIDEKTGKTVPKYFVISKGDVGQIAWNPIEFGLDKMWKKDSEKTGAFLVNYLSDLSPVEFARKGKISASKAAGGLLPPIVKGFAEDWANLNLYTGYEIVPHYMRKNKPPELQYKEWTPTIYKKLGKTLNIAPLRLQNFASNVVAGYGREGLSPTSMLRGLTGRVIRTQGGEIENRAWTTIKDIEQGYIYTSAYAQEMIKNGDKKGALKILRQWNKGIGKQITTYNVRFGKYGFKDRGGLRRSYTFTAEKIRNILSIKQEKSFGLERKLKK